MGKTITITEEQLRKIVEVEISLALAKAKFPIDGFSIVKHAVDSIDDSQNWSEYWEKNHESHHFPSEPHICPSCLLLKNDFVGGNVVCNGVTYILPVCETCNKEYKYSKAEEHPFYAKNGDMVRAPED